MQIEGKQCSPKGAVGSESILFALTCLSKNLGSS